MLKPRIRLQLAIGACALILIGALAAYIAGDREAAIIMVTQAVLVGGITVAAQAHRTRRS